MPAYKYTLKDGKTTRWYANFYFTDWTGEKKHICKRGFKTQREAKEYERSFLDQQNNTSDILFSSLVENYLEEKRIPLVYPGRQKQTDRKRPLKRTERKMI